MKTPLQHSGSTPKAGFSIVELMIAATVMLMLSACFVSVMKYTGYAMLGITQQAEFNQMASNTTMQIIKRVRFCHTFKVSTDGNTLTLTFDTDSEVDSNEDGDFNNDADNKEIFQFTDGTMTYQPSELASPLTLARGVIAVNDQAIFKAISNKPRQIDINFELYNKLTNNGRTQRIDISTSAYRTNGI
jgi:type II secretory pathway pseudopilin PulG